MLFSVSPKILMSVKAGQEMLFFFLFKLNTQAAILLKLKTTIR